jgi:hypothetical protein
VNVLSSTVSGELAQKGTGTGTGTEAEVDASSQRLVAVWWSGRCAGGLGWDLRDLAQGAKKTGNDVGRPSNGRRGAVQGRHQTAGHLDA